MAVEENTREIESTIVTDLRDQLTHDSYLGLDTPPASQHPRSEPEHHDELLFIIQHQTTELWLQLVLHELDDARVQLAADDLGAALKRIARVKHIQEALTQHRSVLATLTPTEYALFRGALEGASGFQSAQYRCVELALGNQHEDDSQFWRFRHLRTVTRTIGEKPGTGGSNGVGFPRRALDLTFLPELYAVRTRIGR